MPTAAAFLARLDAMRSPEELTKIQRYFKTGPGGYAEGDVFIGVRMGDVFALAREFVDMPPEEIENLLESPVHEARAGALSIMGKQATRKRTTQERRRELYELYVRRTDRIDCWDLVDLSAHHVVGGWLWDRSREILYRLARSPVQWERRIAVYATLHFVRKGDLDDTYALAEILLHDDEDLVQKVVGGLLRETGTRDRDRLLAFLDQHAADMPPTMLRYAMEHLDPGVRAHYRGLRS